MDSTDYMTMLTSSRCMDIKKAVQRQGITAQDIEQHRVPRRTTIDCGTSTQVFNILTAETTTITGNYTH